MKRVRELTEGIDENLLAGSPNGSVAVIRPMQIMYLGMRIRISLLFILLSVASYIQAQEILNPTIKPNTVFTAGET
ncbi:MAG TPA: hypothetical protein VGK38_00505, partial [Prolixibacteraceae bacterium]